MDKLNKVYNVDARKLGSIITEPIIDVTITSPPYFDLKDYGSADQIGYGQEYEQYLDDLKLVFEQVYNITKDTGTLWVIIDAFRRNEEVVPLPFDFSNKISGIGWKLQEIIIWGKDRTVPWAHKGQMRSLFEYILVFSKTKDYNFFIDEVRDFQSLKKWWVKYPERYNPKGKTPDAIWNFEIPTQGSWGNGYIRHFCPLPEDMISQMLKITTKENHVVLDCFSGSGAVLSKAANMKRNYLGFELNNEYIRMFDDYIKKTGDQKRKEYELEERNSMKQDKFEKLILNLRSLKYARIFIKQLIELYPEKNLKVFAEPSTSKPSKKNSLISVRYKIYLQDLKNFDKANELLKALAEKAPLSKFGIEPIYSFSNEINEFSKSFSSKNLYLYDWKITHKFKKKFESSDLTQIKKNDLLISPIKVDLDEKDYE
ncbi:MAG: site-specific DNA-methyltransferase [Bacteroidetes bacterium]|nr:site-specific DNA-methyltransferase [Bacteroidota bacterium]